MKAAAGLADLARLVARLGYADARSAAPLLGYDPPEGRPPSRENNDEARSDELCIERSPSEHETAREPLPDVPVATPARARFWRVTRFDAHPSVEPPPRYADNADPRLPGERRGDLFDLPPPLPLVAWQRLWPTLHEALRSEVPGRAPDVPRLIGALARGTLPARVPRMPCRAWARRVRLWIEHDSALIPLWHDHHIVARRLRALLGRDLPVHWWTTARAADAAQLPEGLACADPVGRGDTLLALGAFDGASMFQPLWQRSLRVAAQRGARVVALVPRVPSPPATPSSCWREVPWGLRRGVRPSGEAIDTLLTMAAMSVLAQPGLLRALRRLLPEADATTELAVWNHEEVERVDSGAWSLREDPRTRRRDAFAALPRPLQKRTLETIRTWHRGLPRELVYAEVLVAESAAPGSWEREEVAEARSFVDRLTSGLWHGQLSREAEWRRYGRLALAGMPTQAWETLTPLGRLWSLAWDGVAGAAPPPGVVMGALLAGRARAPEVRPWALRQVGATLVPSARESSRWPSDADGPGSPVALVETASAIVMRTGPGGERWQVVLDAQAPIALATAQLSLEDAQGMRHLEALPREPWMDAMGQDRYGLWCEVRVTDAVSFRMRWIPPGRFTMGSPVGELGRFDNEMQHHVVLTKGYWLGETPVTQAMWRAVMNTNPSHFLGEHRPVERVSWDEAMAFCGVMNARAPELALSLPTEAEWEYACRAGTVTATWNGNLSGEYSAPELDSNAWYMASSGGETHDVGNAHANPWGLHDMLGNVWEWCADTFHKIQHDAVDPLVRGDRGARRAARGGSWHSDARRVRASYRLAYDSGFRDDNLGFRVARGRAGWEGGVERQALR